MAEFISQRGRRRKRRRETWAVVHGILVFAIGLPVLLFAAWLNGDLPAETIPLRTIVVHELPAADGYAGIEGAVRPVTHTARRRAQNSGPPVPLIPAPGFEVLAPTELEAISQAR